MVEKACIEDVMKVLIVSRKQDLHQLWTCSHLITKLGLPSEVLAKHMPIDVVAKIDDLRLNSSISRRSPFLAHHHQHHQGGGIKASVAELDDHHKIRRMRRALDSSDVELVKLMVMGEGINLDEALALHYAVENCSWEVVKALLEVMSQEDAHNAAANSAPIYGNTPNGAGAVYNASGTNTSMVNLSLGNRMVYLNLRMDVMNHGRYVSGDVIGEDGWRWTGSVEDGRRTVEIVGERNRNVCKCWGRAATGNCKSREEIYVVARF